MACIPDDWGGGRGMHLFICPQNYLDPIHGGLDVQIVERYTDYRKARNEGSHIFNYRIKCLMFGDMYIYKSTQFLTFE